MAPHSASLIRSTLIDLDANDVHIIYRPDTSEPGWFVTHQQETDGPYSSPEEAIQAGNDWNNQYRANGSGA